MRVCAMRLCIRKVCQKGRTFGAHMTSVLSLVRGERILFEPPAVKRPRGRPRIHPTKPPARPLILLDMDVIIATLTEEHLSVRWPDFKTFCSMEGPYGGECSFSYSQTVVDAINEWSEVADVRWLTNWDVKLREYIAAAMGLKKFKHGRAPHAWMKKVNSAVHFINTSAPDRFIIWIDRENKEYTSNVYGTEHEWGKHNRLSFERGNTMLMAPYFGLTREHLALVTSVLADTDPQRSVKLWQGKYIEEFEYRGEPYVPTLNPTEVKPYVRGMNV
jgi:hypothetical protein